MSHAAQRNFILKLKESMPDRFVGAAVLDIGSRDINGSNRGFFEGGSYLGVDRTDGKNVDVVAVAHKVPIETEYDVVISTEVLEHDPHWKETVEHAVKALKSNGLLILTCAGEGRAEHGTDKTLSDYCGGYYLNLSLEDLGGALRPEERFEPHELSFEPSHCDLQFWGIKR